MENRLIKLGKISTKIGSCMIKNQQMREESRKFVNKQKNFKKVDQQLSALGKRLSTIGEYSTKLGVYLSEELRTIHIQFYDEEIN